MRLLLRPVFEEGLASCIVCPSCITVSLTARASLVYPDRYIPFIFGYPKLSESSKNDNGVFSVVATVFCSTGDLSCVVKCSDVCFASSGSPIRRSC